MVTSEPGMSPGDELAGQVAIVTGAGRNIGRAIARALAAGGASVVVHARSSRAEAAETVKLIEASGGQASVVLGDLTQPDDVDHLVQETVDRFGRIDALVNNAAVRHETSLMEMSLDEWHSVLNATLDTAFLCTKAVLPFMLESGGGSIINIGGQTGHDPVAERAHVITAKGGMAAFTKAVAIEFADRNVTVNCVVPGSIDTVRGVPGAPERPPSRRVPPLGRRGSVWEIAAMVRMLAGPAGRYVTGQAIHVNGGGFMP